MLVVPTAVETKTGGASNRLQQPTNYHFRVKLAMSTNRKRVAKQKRTTMPQERRQAAFCFSCKTKPDSCFKKFKVWLDILGFSDSFSDTLLLWFILRTEASGFVVTHGTPPARFIIIECFFFTLLYWFSVFAMFLFLFCLLLFPFRPLPLAEWASACPTICTGRSNKKPAKRYGQE